MARRDSQPPVRRVVGRLIALSLALGACDSVRAPQIIVPPDGAPGATADADVDADVDAGVGGAGDAGASGSTDAAPPPTLSIDTTAIAGCDARTVEVGVDTTVPVQITPVVDGVPRAPARVSPGAPLVLEIAALAEGPHAVAFDVAGARLPGPVVTVDRSPPRLRWQEPVDVCIADTPAPVVDDVSPVEIFPEDAVMGCRLTRQVRAVDACGFESTARRTWRVGPPNPPSVNGVRALSWPVTDACTTLVRAWLGRVGEAPVRYIEGAVIEWPGDYQLTLRADGCNGPTETTVPVAVPAHPCDRPTRPIDSGPNVRGWLEISSARLVDLSLELAGRGLAAATPVRDAAVLLARHPAFPNACPARDECLIGADWRTLLEALSRASDALVEAPDTRGARRCVVEAARVVVTAGNYAPAACAAPDDARVLVDAWDDPAARARVLCLCRGDCAPTLDCADAPVLEANGDPIALSRQIAAIGGPGALDCLDDPDCPALPALVDRLRVALRAGDCEARGLMSVVALIVGRRCAGIGRFRHPGTDALAAAQARWPMGQAGVAATLADLDRALAACAQ